MTTTTHFEDRLLQQLRQIVAENPDPGVAGAAQRAPRRTRLALAGAGVAAASAVAIVATSSDVTPSAYAVQPRADGSVSVRIRSLSDAAGLQRSLRDAGVPAVVDYTPADAPGCAAAGAGGGVASSHAPEAGVSSSGAPADGHRTGHAIGGAVAGPTTQTRSAAGTEPTVSRPAPAARAGTAVVTSTTTLGDDGTTFMIDPGTIKPGEKVYIRTSTGAASTIGIAIGKDWPYPDCAAPAG